MLVRRPLIVVALAAFALGALGSIARADADRVLTRVKGSVAIQPDGTARTGKVAGHTIGIDRGALKFTVRHPADGHANYRFVTPTGQITVRGTSGILIVTPSKTTLICLDCGPDDLVATHDSTDESLATGEVLQIVGPPGSQSVVKLPLKGFVDPAIVQFLGDTYARAMTKAMPAIEAAMKPRATPNPCSSGAGNRISSETASETFDTVGSRTNCK